MDKRGRCDSISGNMKRACRLVAAGVLVLLFALIAGPLLAQDTIGSLSTSAGVRRSRAVSNPNYPVTPGDVYVLSWTIPYQGGGFGEGAGGGGSATGGTSNRLDLYVASDYQVNLEFFGTINAEGLTFQEFRDNVVGQVQNAYPGSTVRLSISTTGEVPVRMVGEVVTSRTIPVWGLTRLGDLPRDLYTDFASVRAIEIQSQDGSTETYDLFQAQRYGDRTENPLLSVGDTIRVPAFDRRVQIQGEVRRPGSYELLPEEGISELIEYAGGYTRRARREDIALTRISEQTRAAQNVRYLTREELAGTSLEDGDVIEIPSRLDNRPVVFLEGAIGEGGAPPNGATRISRTIRGDQRLSDFGPAIQGLFTPVSDLENAYIRRDMEIIAVDLIDLLYGPGTISNDPVLEPEDVLVIPFKQFQVTVLGAVNRPGTYPYVPNKSWRYYIEQAGGFNPDLNDGRAVRILDAEDNEVAKDESIGPEFTIRARRNDVRFWYLRYAGLTTTTIDLVTAILDFIDTVSN